MAVQSGGGGPKKSAYLERQCALLYNMLQATREQRRCLIAGDLKGLEETNRLLGSLLECQEALHGESHDPKEPTSHHLLQELRDLARELRRESRANYLLASRGAQLTDFSISLLREAVETSSGSPDAETASSPSQPRLMDRPA